MPKRSASGFSRGFHMKLTGDKELKAKLKQISIQAQTTYLDMAVKAGALLIENEAKRLAPVESGDLRRSITTTLGQPSTPLIRTYYIGTNLIYGPIQEYGGTIRPKTGRFLVFEVDGELVFATKVRIPAHPYLRPAFDSKKAEARALAATIFKERVLSVVIL